MAIYTDESGSAERVSSVSQFPFPCSSLPLTCDLLQPDASNGHIKHPFGLCGCQRDDPAKRAERLGHSMNVESFRLGGVRGCPPVDRPAFKFRIRLVFPLVLLRSRLAAPLFLSTRFASGRPPGSICLIHDPGLPDSASCGLGLTTCFIRFLNFSFLSVHFRSFLPFLLSLTIASVSYWALKLFALWTCFSLVFLYLTPQTRPFFRIQAST